MDFFKKVGTEFQDDYVKMYPEIPTIDDSPVKNVTFVVTNACNLSCFPAGTKITMGDFTTKNIEDIKAGDIVLGYPEFSDKDNPLTFYPTRVSSSFSQEKTYFTKLELEDGGEVISTSDHPFRARPGREGAYREAQNWKVDQSLHMMFGTSDETIDYDSEDYKIGFFIACMLGDGLFKKYGTSYHFRFVVKDQELNDKFESVGRDLGFTFRKANFLISKKENLYREAIHSKSPKEGYCKLLKLIDDYFGKVNTKEYLSGFLSGIFDCEGSCGKDQSEAVRIVNTDEKILEEVEKGLDLFGFAHIRDVVREGVNKEVNCVRVLCGVSAGERIRFLLILNPSIKRKGIEGLYGNRLGTTRKIVKTTSFEKTQIVYNMETESHTYIASNALVHNCSYCYLHNKDSSKMTFEQGKKIVDMLFEEDERDSKYINYYNANALIIEFIGGEPLLEIDLIDNIMRYFRWKAVKLHHRWATKYMISISTNGIKYTDRKVQNFIFKNYGRLSITITIDGNKDLHDSCRVFPDGSPSYDIVADAVKKYRNLVCSLYTKLTIAPQNVMYLFDAVKNLKEEFHMDGVYANCIYEEGWAVEDARILYEQMVKISDWIIDNDYEKEFFCTLFDDSIGTSMREDELEVYCGGNARMLSFTSDGNIQPCLRFTKASLGCAAPQLNIGSLEEGIGQTPEHQSALESLEAIDRRTISTDKCFNCPIARGCAYCVAYNYETFGTPNSRATFICDMHQARVLANYYHWKNIGDKYGIDLDFNLNLPDDWAERIISKKELEELKKKPS